MSRLTISFARKNSNVEDVIRCLKLFFAIHWKPYALYVAWGQHFDCEEIRHTLQLEGIPTVLLLHTIHWDDRGLEQKS